METGWRGSGDSSGGASPLAKRVWLAGLIALALMLTPTKVGGQGVSDNGDRGGGSGGSGSGSGSGSGGSGGGNQFASDSDGGGGDGSDGSGDGNGDGDGGNTNGGSSVNQTTPSPDSLATSSATTAASTAAVPCTSNVFCPAAHDYCSDVRSGCAQCPSGPCPINNTNCGEKCGCDDHSHCANGYCVNASVCQPECTQHVHCDSGEHCNGDDGVCQTGCHSHEQCDDGEFCSGSRRCSNCTSCRSLGGELNTPSSLPDCSAKCGTATPLVAPTTSAPTTVPTASEPTSAPITSAPTTAEPTVASNSVGDAGSDDVPASTVAIIVLAVVGVLVAISCSIGLCIRYQRNHRGRAQFDGNVAFGPGMAVHDGDFDRGADKAAILQHGRAKITRTVDAVEPIYSPAPSTTTYAVVSTVLLPAVEPSPASSTTTYDVVSTVLLPAASPLGPAYEEIGPGTPVPAGVTAITSPRAYTDADRDTEVCQHTSTGGLSCRRTAAPQAQFCAKHFSFAAGRTISNQSKEHGGGMYTSAPTGAPTVQATPGGTGPAISMEGIYPDDGDAASSVVSTATHELYFAGEGLDPVEPEPVYDDPDDPGDSGMVDRCGFDASEYTMMGGGGWGVPTVGDAASNLGDGGEGGGIYDAMNHGTGTLTKGVTFLSGGGDDDDDVGSDSYEKMDHDPAHSTASATESARPRAATTGSTRDTQGSGTRYCTYAEAHAALELPEHDYANLKKAQDGDGGYVNGLMANEMVRDGALTSNTDRSAPPPVRPEAAKPIANKAAPALLELPEHDYANLKKAQDGDGGYVNGLMASEMVRDGALTSNADRSAPPPLRPDAAKPIASKPAPVSVPRTDATPPTPPIRPSMGRAAGEGRAEGAPNQGGKGGQTPQGHFHQSAPDLLLLACTIKPRSLRLQGVATTVAKASSEAPAATSPFKRQDSLQGFDGFDDNGGDNSDDDGGDSSAPRLPPKQTTVVWSR